MARCPKCGREIDHLNYWSLEWVKRSYWVNDDGEGEWSSSKDWVSTDNDDEYECPWCCEVLFHSEEEAREFLAGQSAVAKN